MNAEVRRARKKPVEIEYMVWPGGAENATLVINWILDRDGTARYRGKMFAGTQVVNGQVEDYFREESINIDTMEGTMTASAGDVIIRGVKGEFYPCKPDIFAATYDLVGS